MKTQEEVATIIGNQLAEVAQSVDDDYKIVVCSERIFVDDYAPKEDEYITQLNQMQEEGEESPLESPYKHTIFFVLKFRSGQQNFALSQMSVSIDCMSEENDFEVARKILSDFSQKYNFRYIDGILQSYFTPSVDSTFEQVYSGFRALLSIRGTVNVPAEGVMFIVDVCLKLEGSDEWFQYPWISESFGHSAVPDPQAFSGTDGSTMSLNKQSTQTVSLVTYLWNHDLTNKTLYPEDDGIKKQAKFENDFTIMIIKAMSKMNRKFRIMLRTNIKDETQEEIGGEKLFPLCDFHYVLTGANNSQQWGDISTWSLVFARSDKETV